ncbi:MAG: hypothetical protein FGF53_05730 [Candidatus Brockarchaeota archaeon]|nr:hypothetical protein [Candidatus Brockarchaeota archaeon]
MGFIEEEGEAFLKIRDKLVQDSLYTGKYVAVFQRAIVGCDEDKERLAETVYEKYGYVPIYIDKVVPQHAIAEGGSKLTWTLLFTCGRTCRGNSTSSPSAIFSHTWVIRAIHLSPLAYETRFSNAIEQLTIKAKGKNSMSKPRSD